MVVRSRFRVWLLASLLLGGWCLAPGPRAAAQNNSLFPKGGPNRNLPQATPLPRGALTPRTSDAAASSASSRHRSAPPPRPDTVALPYNLVWFDSQNRLASLFAGVSAKVADKKTDGPNEIWTVNELIAPNLRTSFFTFQQGMLIGLEFDYGQDAWDTNKYNEVMGQFRRLLETKCESPGEIISRKSDQVPNSTVKETLMGYQWVRGDTTVQLFYYAAEDTEKALNFRSISVHYHYRDPFAPPPGTQPSPAPAALPTPAGQTASVTVTPAGPDNAPGGTLPQPDNMPPASTPASTPGPTPAAGNGSPGATAPPRTEEGQLPGPEPVETDDGSDAAAAMAPAPTPGPEASPSASPSPTPTPTATPTPTPSPTPRKSSGHKRRG